MNAKIRKIEDEMGLDDFYMTPRDFLDSITRSSPYDFGVWSLWATTWHVILCLK